MIWKIGAYREVASHDDASIKNIKDCLSKLMTQRTNQRFTKVEQK